MRFQKGGSPSEKVNDFFQKGVHFLKKVVHFFPKVTWQEEMATDTITPATVEVSGTEVEEYTQDIQGTTFTIKNGETDVTSNYKIAKVDGGFEIVANEKEITIESASETWVYDGAEHTKPVYTVTYGGQTVTASNEAGTEFPLDGSDTLKITSTATAVKNVTTEEDANNNTFTYELSYPAGYATPTTTVGTLAVTPRPITITGTTIADPIPYDGASHSVSAYTYTEPSEEKPNEGLLAGDTITPTTVTVSGTEIGEYTQNIQGTTFVIKNGDDVVTGNYEITKENGGFEIVGNTKAITITSANETWVYDGAEHTKPVPT